MKGKASLCAWLQEQSIAYSTSMSLSDFTSFKIGGPVGVAVFPGEEQEIIDVVSYCAVKQIPCLVLGNGSNVLASDEGYDGVIIITARELKKIELISPCTIRAQAGVSLTQLCRFAQQHGLSGLEFAYGIPATVGGAVFMNAGAYGGEMKDVVTKAWHVLSDGTPGTFEGEALDFSYRHSAYSSLSAFILGAEYSLTPGDSEEILRQMQETLEKRKSKQPLEYPSAGSTFKRPVGAFAAKLIEDCGLKGFRVGDAQVSTKHSGFVINTGHATCKQVEELIREVQRIVKEKTGFTLECEVRRLPSQEGEKQE